MQRIFMYQLDDTSEVKQFLEEAKDLPVNSTIILDLDGLTLNKRDTRKLSRFVEQELEVELMVIDQAMKLDIAEFPHRGNVFPDMKEVFNHLLNTL